MSLKTSLFSFCITCVTPFYVLANCELTALTITPLSAQTQYDTSSPGDYSLIQSFQIEGKFSTKPCKADINIGLTDETLSLSFKTHKLNFDWYSQTGLKQLSHWTTQLSDKSPKTIIEMRYPANQWIAAGIYSSTLQVISKNTMGPIQANHYPIDITVTPSSRISFYGLYQSDYNVDLGILQSDHFISSMPKLWVQSNTKYNVIINSRNNGHLQYKSAFNTWKIPYHLFANEEKINLETGGHYAHSSTTRNGTTIALKVIIGDSENKASGLYDDTLNISIEPVLSQQP